MSAFVKNDGAVFHTYSAYARGLDILVGAYNFLDFAPKGRDEDALPWTMAWVRRHGNPTAVAPEDWPRRVVAASLLDLAVRHGEPYAALLATAKSLAPNADALKPLEAFAASGVPSPAGLDRELLTLVPKLSPPV